MSAGRPNKNMINPIPSSQKNSGAGASESKTIAFNHEGLLFGLTDDFRHSPNELEDYENNIDAQSNTELTGDPASAVKLCLALDDKSTTDSLEYLLLEHDLENTFTLTEVQQSDQDPYIELYSGNLDKTPLTFFRELNPVNRGEANGPAQVKLTAFSTGNISMFTDTYNLQYGIDKDTTRSNPNQYKIRAKISSDPKKDFYTDEAFYSFDVEINDQGNVFKLPLVVAHDKAKSTGIDPTKDFKAGNSIETDISLQGRF